MFKINDISIDIESKQIVKKVNISCSAGSVHAIMGPNGSGKSSLAYALMGHPRYVITTGSIALADVDLTTLAAHERARAGLFLSLQHPVEVPGLSVFNFLKESYGALHGVIPVPEFQQLLYATMDTLGMDHAVAYRGVNEGFSGGEKKRLEMLQLLLLKPKVVILDEIDSGLDVDALKVVAHGIMRAKEKNPALVIILITHYQRILQYVRPDFVHVIHQGVLVRSGDATLAEDIEQKGYDDIIF
ncbi:Fe-S cluster assembly ATPase SufC [Candidatus Dependentiae bacterium]|nr:Fe-S cluster assembly ATPase SufC [Candidatus Dependentiae bacterium]